MAKDATYKGQREIRTFVDLHHGANVLIQKTENEPEGSYFTAMGALILCAFTFEAYLNHLGDKTLKFWSEIDSIKVMDKYAVLCKHFDLSPNFSRRPYQTLQALFKFRNAIAHGKSEVLKETKEVSSRDDLHGHAPKAHWEEYCKLENVKRARQDVSNVIGELHKAAGLGDFPFVSGMTSGVLSLKQSGSSSMRGRRK